MTTIMTPQARADASARHLMLQDAASRGAGVRITSVGPGTASARMRVRPDMINGNGICHGGYIFILADSAFAFACNSDNTVTVAQANQITYVSPGRAGEWLNAEAQEVATAGRSGTYDVTVRGEDSRVVALFRGLCRKLADSHFDENEGTS